MLLRKFAMKVSRGAKSSVRRTTELKKLKCVSQLMKQVMWSRRSQTKLSEKIGDIYSPLLNCVGDSNQ